MNRLMQHVTSKPALLFSIAPRKEEMWPKSAEEWVAKNHGVTIADVAFSNDYMLKAEQEMYESFVTENPFPKNIRERFLQRAIPELLEMSQGILDILDETAWDRLTTVCKGLYYHLYDKEYVKNIGILLNQCMAHEGEEAGMELMRIIFYLTIVGAPSTMLTKSLLSTLIESNWNNVGLWKR